MQIDNKWYVTESGCGAFLMKAGGDPEKIADRYAFIEKTPRIRIRSYDWFNASQDYLSWAERGFKGDDCHDEDSRKWCEEALKLFDYDLVTVI